MNRPKAKLIDESDKVMFPIESVSGVSRLFSRHFDKEEPDLVLLSLVIGAIENSIVQSHSTKATPIPNNKNSKYFQNSNQSNQNTNSNEIHIPVISYELIESLYSKFCKTITDAYHATHTISGRTNRSDVKKVADIVWNTLTRSYYKDRPHIQSLFSYLNGNKLDCFGVAYAVVAGCQVLGLADVHLVLSEDHAWVSFGTDDRKESAEVTWHGKGNEDKRGEPIKNFLHSWLYLSGHPVECTRQMEVAALISAINPSLSSTKDALELAVLQQELLWLAYDYGHLKKYPMALGNLSDLEEISVTPARPSSLQLYEEGVEIAKRIYFNQHVYPYTFKGGYFYRKKKFIEALECWASAANVIKKYNYSRDDEEIYKEFFEIANELIPNMVKMTIANNIEKLFLNDSKSFANFLRFFDGVCKWEEGSLTPVLHIAWAKAFCSTLAKFDSGVRLNISIVYDDTNNNQISNNDNSNGKIGSVMLKNIITNRGTDKTINRAIIELSAGCSEKILNPEFLLQGDGTPFVGLQETKNNARTLREKKPVEKTHEKDQSEVISGKPTIILCSQKMNGLKSLIMAEKINSQAITLQLTAQSQVQVTKRVRAADDNHIEDILRLKKLKSNC